MIAFFDRSDPDREGTMAAPTFEAVGLAPAVDGWRAVYSGSGGTFAVPLVCWGVFRKTTSGAPAENVIAGVVSDRQPGGPIRFLVCAEEQSNFEGYLEPGEPNP
jgi:hypothetical protein